MSININKDYGNFYSKAASLTSRCSNEELQKDESAESANAGENEAQTGSEAKALSDTGLSCNEISLEAQNKNADAILTSDTVTLATGSVSFNQEKRARQLASAATPEQVQMLIGMLNVDLSDCKAGFNNGMCDKSEVAKAEAMLQRAKQRMSEVNAESAKPEQEGKSVNENAFYMNLLI